MSSNGNFRQGATPTDGDPLAMPKKIGVKQVRQPIVATAIFLVLIFLGLSLWIVVTRAAAQVSGVPASTDPSTAPSFQPSTVRSTDGTTGDSRGSSVRTSSSPRTVPTVGPPPFDQEQVAQQIPPAPPTAPTQSPTQSPIAQAQARASAEANAARESDLAVKLDNNSGAVASEDSSPKTTIASGSSGNHYAAVSGSDPDAYDVSPASEFIVQRGMIIPATLYTSIDSTIPGTITAIVSSDVYDSRHRAVLIPRGSKLTGSFQSNVAQGQARIMVVWDGVKLPDDHTIPLGTMPGVDLSGTSGFGAAVDRHTALMLRNVVLLSILGAGAQLSQPQTSTCGSYNACAPTVGQQLASSVGQQMTQAGTQIYARDASIPPTLHVSEGSQVAVMVEEDLPLRPWGTSR